MREDHGGGAALIPAPTSGPPARALWTDRGYLLRAFFGLAVVIGYWLWVRSGRGTPDIRAAVSEGLLVLLPLAAAHASFSARRGSGHTGWVWIAAGCVAWASGALTWAAYDLVWGVRAPFPSWADFGYLGYAVPLAIGITRFPRARTTSFTGWRLVLDSVVIGGAVLFTTMVWVLDPVVDSPLSMWARVHALAFPVAHVVVVTLVLSRCLASPGLPRRVWLPLCIGLITLAVTDSAYVVRSATGDYVPGGLLDIGWLVCFVLVALGAGAARPHLSPVGLPEVTSVVVDGRPAHPHEPGIAADLAPVPGSPEPAPMLQQLLPYAAILAAGVALLGETAAVTRSSLVWLLIPVLAVVAAREFVTVADHVALARGLAAEVDRRTAALLHEQQWWRELVQNLTLVVVVVDTDGSIRFCSPSARTALGAWPQRAEHALELQGSVHPDDLSAAIDVIRPVIAGERRTGSVECRLRRFDGSWGWFEVMAVGQLSEQALEGTVLILHDVSERRQLTDRLTHEARHDALTGLPNRSLLMERIETALVRKGDLRSALLMVDLDDFKVINDRHGHASGDLVLEVIGRRLQRTVRAGDTVARLGGDEFALLMTGSAEQVRTTAERLIEQIGKPVNAGGRRFLVRASIGIVFASEDESETPHSLLSHADIALYEAKAKDKGGIVVIDGDERDAAAKKVHLKEQIAQPDLRQFAVVYQPIVELTTGLIRGVEALLRWNHPDLGSVPPDEFIPMAEHGGSIQKLGWYVLEESCAQLAAWMRETPHHRLAVGVNVSSRQLDEPGFADRVLALVAKHGIEPAMLVLELTEQSLAVDFETAVEVVTELRAGGVSVAVDDYGTGYSSLRYLHRFAADVVKIDRSFVANLEGSVHTQKIVGSVIEMAYALDLQSIAEGIETPAQAELVRTLGCELGQGFLFSRPVTADQVSRLVAAGGVLAVTTPGDVAVTTAPTHS